MLAAFFNYIPESILWGDFNDDFIVVVWGLFLVERIFVFDTGDVIFSFLLEDVTLLFRDFWKIDDEFFPLFDSGVTFTSFNLFSSERSSFSFRSDFNAFF